MSLPRSEASKDRGLERVAGALFLVAAAVHGIVAPAHFAEWWGYGIFFVFAGSLQAVWGLALLTDAINPRDAGGRWHRLKTGLLVLGILGTLAILLLYVVTRTSGIPFFGTEAGVVEKVEAIDVVSKAVEGALLVVLAVLLRRHLRGPQVPAQGPGDGADRA